MEKALDGNFYNPTCGNLSLDGVIDELLNYIKDRPEKRYDIIVGCDSSSSEEPNFPLAVVVLRAGEGGRFFLKRIFYDNRKFYNWKERIREETMLSCQFAVHLKEIFEKKISSLNLVEGKDKLNYQLRHIHADVGENGATRDMIK